MVKRYTLSTDLLRKNFTNTKLTFSIEHIRSEQLAMVRPILRLYTTGKSYLTQYASNWWVIGSEYQQQ